MSDDDLTYTPRFIADLVRQRDRARDIAVALEQENARLRGYLDHRNAEAVALVGKTICCGSPTHWPTAQRILTVLGESDHEM